MDMKTAVTTCLSKYATFSGRALRSEYWWWALFVLVCSFVITFVETIINLSADGEVPILTTVFNLAIILPGISVLVRRLHDTNHSGWWYWIILVPFAGVLILLYFLIIKGTDGPNDFGDDPAGNRPQRHDNHDGAGRSDIPSVRR